MSGERPPEAPAGAAGRRAGGRGGWIFLAIVAGLYGLVALFDREAAGRSLQVFAVLGGLVMGRVEEG